VNLKNWRHYIAIPFLSTMRGLRWLWRVINYKYAPFFLVFLVALVFTVWLYGSPFNSYTQIAFPDAVTSENPTFRGDLATALQLPLHVSRNVFHIRVKVCPEDAYDVFLSTTTNVASIKIGGQIQPYAQSGILGRACPMEIIKINNNPPALFCFKEGDYSEFTYPAGLGFAVGGAGPFTDCMPPDPRQGLLKIWVTPSWTSYGINFFAVYLGLVVLYSVYITIRDRHR